MIGIVIGILAIVLGAKSFTANGLPLTRKKNLSGSLAKILGVVCVLVGVIFFADGLLSSFNLYQLFHDKSPRIEKRYLKPEVLVGQWKNEIVSVVNGHSMTVETIETFRQDRTYLSESRTDILSGDDGKRLVMVRVEAAGTWTFEKNRFCKHGDTAGVVEFESNAPEITRDMYEDLLREEPAPECFTIQFRDARRIVMIGDKTGGEWTLTRHESE